MIPGVIIEGNTLLGDSIWCRTLVIWSKIVICFIFQSRMLYHLLLLGLWVGTAMGEDSLQAVDDAELAKLAQEEKFVVALLCTEENSERCILMLLLKLK